MSPGPKPVAVIPDAPHGFEVRVRGRIGRPQLRYFEPWWVASLDGRTSIWMHDADRAALSGLLRRLDDFALELVAVVPISRETAEYAQLLEAAHAADEQERRTLAEEMLQRALVDLKPPLDIAADDQQLESLAFVADARDKRRAHAADAVLWLRGGDSFGALDAAVRAQAMPADAVRETLAAWA